MPAEVVAQKETPLPGRHSPGLRRRLHKIVRELFADQYADAMDILDRAAGRKTQGSIEPDWRRMFTAETLKRWADDTYPVIRDGMDFGAVMGREDIQFEIDKVGVRLSVSPWDVEAPGARQAVKEAAMALSTSSNEVTARQMAQIVPRIRSQLIQGIAKGETYDLIAGKIKQIFGHADKYRSMRIASTETQRAIHAGALEQYKTSGVVEAKAWLTSGSPCDVCIAIAAENEAGIAMAREFARIGKSETYAAVQHPPAHPNCLCSMYPVLLPVEQIRRTNNT